MTWWLSTSASQLREFSTMSGDSLGSQSCLSQTPNPSTPCPYSPWTTTSLLSVTGSLSGSIDRLIRHILDSTCKWYLWNLSFSFWLTSASMIICRSIHVAENVVISLCFYAERCSITCVYVPVRMYTPSLPVRLSVDVRTRPCLGYCPQCCCGHYGVHASVQITVFSGCAPRHGIAGSYTALL